jgi:hypothetical protein
MARQVINMDKDGHCGFRAIVRAMENNLGKSEEMKKIKEIRKKTSNLLRNNKTRIFANLSLENLMMQEFHSNTPMVNDFEKYCNEIQKNAYIGAIEIILLAEDLKKDITTYQTKDNELSKMWATNDSDFAFSASSHLNENNEKIMLLFSGGNHYDLLLERVNDFL